MDKKEISEFFHFIENSDKLESSLQKFRNDFNLRQEIWSIDNLDLYLIKKQVNDYMLRLSWKLSLKAINEKNKGLINSAMAVLSIENFTIDYRDSLIRLSIINHACEKLNVNFKNVINTAKEYSSERAIKQYTNYLSKPLNKKGALYSMGLCEVNKNGIIHIEFKPPMQMIR